ncbi:MAG: transcriptional regulator, partial [Firmicutes bacterium]|nr:transcriptional regulator [Bacillota bacterium]
MKTALLVYNPKAGSGMIKGHLDFIFAKFQDAGYCVIPVRGARPEELDHIMKHVDAMKVDRIIAAGGDGTINQVVNSMVRNDVHLPMAIFPVGTANDFAYYFRIPGDIEQMVEIALSDITKPVDIGEINGQYFINVAAMGCL